MDPCLLAFFIIRFAKRPRGTPRPPNHLSVRDYLSVREVPLGPKAMMDKFRSALRAESLIFPKEIEGKIENFRSALRAESLFP